MSDMSDDELLATKLLYGAMNIDDLLNYWRLNYDIPLFEIDRVRNYIKELEKGVNKND